MRAPADAPRHRLYVDAALSPGSEIALDAGRSHYLCRVLRLRKDDRVLLFAGDGDGYDAAVVRADPRACTVAVGERLEREPPPRFELHLAQALIKRDRLDSVLQKATELGVTKITLLDTEHSEVHLSGERIGRRLEHWRGIVVGAAEQSGRLRLPTLVAPAELHAFVATATGARYLLDPGSAPLAGAAEADTVLLLGPEGGFSNAERALAIGKGFVPVGLGERILRSDTAPVAALAVLRQAWGWRSP